MRAFQGSFHMNPDFAFWYGYSQMQQDLVGIKEMAREVRRRVPRGKKVNAEGGGQSLTPSGFLPVTNTRSAQYVPYSRV